jgi:hypothetical protein
MEKLAMHQPLSNLQLELLKLFTQKVSDTDLLEIKRLVSSYFAEKAMDAADKVWEEKGWTNSDMEKLANTRMRTTYNSSNE